MSAKFIRYDTLYNKHLLRLPQKSRITKPPRTEFYMDHEVSQEKQGGINSIYYSTKLEPQVGKYSNTQTLKRHTTKKIYLLLRCPSAIALASEYVLISIGAAGPAAPFSTARAPGTGGARVTAASGLVVLVGCAPASVVTVGACWLSANIPPALSEMDGWAAVVAAVSETAVSVDWLATSVVVAVSDTLDAPPWATRDGALFD